MTYIGKVTVVAHEDRVYVENADGDVRSMECYEFLIDLESILDFLRIEGIEVVEVEACEGPYERP